MNMDGNEYDISSDILQSKNRYIYIYIYILDILIYIFL